MYADDSTLFTTGKTIVEVENKINTDLVSIQSWCNQNKMSINLSKTKSMLMTTTQRLSRLHQKNISCKLGVHSLKSVEIEKLLGVIIDQHLNWKANIDQIFKRINTNISLLRRVKCFLPPSARKTFYNAYLLPHFDYCCSLWGTSTVTHVNKLCILQRRAVRVMTDSGYRQNTGKLFRALHIMPLTDRIKYRNMCLVFKALNGIAPAYLSKMFCFINQCHTRMTRASTQNKLLVPKAKLNVLKNSWPVNGSKIWNNLNSDIRSARSFLSFKKLYISNYWSNFKESL